MKGDPTTAAPQAATPPPGLDRVADGLFAAFVYVADAGAGLTASDVEQWHAWLRRPRNRAPQAWQPLAETLATSFTALWKRHVAAGKRPQLARVVADLQCWQTMSAGDPASLVREELQVLLDACASRQATGALPWTRRTTSAERLAARDALEAAWQAALSGEDLAPDEGAAESAANDASTLTTAAGAGVDAPPSDVLMLPGWPRRGVRLRCAAVIDETHDVRTFVFRAVQPQLFAYQPGQFMTLELPLADGRILRRSYTISSSPSRPHTVTITVKRVPGGQGSNWIHDHVRPGFECKVSGPHGHFSCGALPQARKLLLIAAGSGVTPIMSMLRWLADTVIDADVVVINNVRTPQDIIFDAELRYLGTRMGSRLRLAVVPSSVAPDQSWNGPTGRFDAELLQRVAPDWISRAVYCCGPAPYMAHVRDTLAGLGLPTAQYHEESFGGAPGAADRAPARGTAGSTAGSSADAKPAVVPAPRPAGPGTPSPVSASSTTPGQADGLATVVFRRSGRSVQAPVGDGLLDVAEEQGIAIPSSCRAGTCGTCKVRKLRGTVEMDDAQALGDDERADGWVLCCVGRIGEGELEIDA